MGELFDTCIYDVLKPTLISIPDSFPKLTQIVTPLSKTPDLLTGGLTTLSFIGRL